MRAVCFVYQILVCFRSKVTFSRAGLWFRPHGVVLRVQIRRRLRRFLFVLLYRKSPQDDPQTQTKGEL